MRFVVVTGMSGGGKSTALRMLEDVGFYCVDNLPVPLIEKFVELIAMPGSEVNKVALGLDVRADQPFEDARRVLEKLREAGYSFEILFMEAGDQTLLKRYKETRRLHPLAAGGRIADGIQQERQRLEFLKKQADYILDTSSLLTRELKTELEKIFVMNQEFKNLMITILSFGFKFGIPGDADLVFDVRFLPNPYYHEELRSLSGNDGEVQKFVMNFDVAHVFLDKLEEMVQFLIPNYVLEGKNQLVVAIGCTGGKHRSVTLANKLYERLEKHSEYGIRVEHRDIEKDAIIKGH